MLRVGSAASHHEHQLPERTQSSEHAEQGIPVRSIRSTGVHPDKPSWTYGGGIYRERIDLEWMGGVWLRRGWQDDRSVLAANACCVGILPYATGLRRQTRTLPPSGLRRVWGQKVRHLRIMSLSIRLAKAVLTAAGTSRMGAQCIGVVPDYRAASQPTSVSLTSGAESFVYDAKSARTTRWRSTAGTSTPDKQSRVESQWNAARRW